MSRGTSCSCHLNYSRTSRVAYTPLEIQLLVTVKGSQLITPRWVGPISTCLAEDGELVVHLRTATDKHTVVLVYQLHLLVEEQLAIHPLYIAYDSCIHWEAQGLKND